MRLQPDGVPLERVAAAVTTSPMLWTQRGARERTADGYYVTTDTRVSADVALRRYLTRSWGEDDRFAGRASRVASQDDLYAILAWATGRAVDTDDDLLPHLSPQTFAVRRS